MIIFRIAIAIFAVLLMLAGLVITPTPLPFGVIIFVIGFLLLATVAPASIRGVRRRWKWFDRRMHDLEDKLPGWLAKPLKASDYDHDAEEEEDDDDDDDDEDEDAEPGGVGARER